jgi:hypothetical protein
MTAVRLALAVLLAAVMSCGDDRPRAARFTSSPGDVEAAWLARVGRGPAQTAAVCARGATDPIARALCRTPAPAIGGLADLYDALGLGAGANRRVAVATHSLGLSARTVSALNPRTIVFPHYSPLTEDGIAAAAFSRGEPFVEMVGYDATGNDFNFYLLAFEPECQSTGRGCEPRDLLTERVESGWVGWTLYADRDLEDTALDCGSCHRAQGPDRRRRLLMRQFDGPWMHWGDFRGITPPTTCTDGTGRPITVEVGLTTDGADLLAAIDGPLGRHGGVPVPELIAAPSGYDLSSFLFYASGIADGIGDVPCLTPYCVFAEPHPFPSQDVLCDWLQTGRGDREGGAWARYRAQVSARGLPVPFFGADLLDPTLRATVSADFANFVAQSAPDGDAFTRLAGLVSDDVARAIGYLPDHGAPAPELLATTCGRCHDGSADPGLARAGFDALALDRLDAAGARRVLDRVSLPRASPDRMPPLRSGDLPDWALTRISDFLRPRL